MWIGWDFSRYFEDNFSVIFQTLNENLERNAESLKNQITKKNVEFELQTDSLEKLKKENSTKTHELKVIVHDTTT